MPIFQARQKYPGEWVFIIDDSDLNQHQKAILAGMAAHVVECIGLVSTVHDIKLDDRLRLDGICREIEDRFLSDQPPPEATTDNYMETLVYPLENAFWAAIAATQIIPDDIQKALRMYTHSVSWLSSFKTNLIWLESESSEREGGPKNRLIDPSTIGRLGAASRWKPRDAVREYALERYNARNWQSRSDGVRRIVGDVCKKADEVGFSYKESNIERTIHDWIRAASARTSAS